MIPAMTPELIAYLDAKFASIEETLDDLKVMILQREAEYGVTMQGIRHIAQHIGTQDALNNLVSSLDQKRRHIAARKKK